MPSRKTKWLNHCDKCDHGFYSAATARKALTSLFGKTAASQCPLCKSKEDVRVVRKVGKG